MKETGFEKNLLAKVQEIDLTKAHAADMLGNAVKDTIEEMALKGEGFSFYGVGTFTVKSRTVTSTPRGAVEPFKSKRLAFTCSTVLRKKLNLIK